jgi:hypothetical protein
MAPSLLMFSGKTSPSLPVFISISTMNEGRSAIPRPTRAATRKAWGWQDREAQRKMVLRVIFRYASLTKAIVLTT